MEKKVLVFGERKEEIVPALKTAGFQIVDGDPEWVVSYGGDGTFMRAEHAYPGVPKLLIKGSRICKLCPQLPVGEIAERLKAGKFLIDARIKLEVMAGKQTMYAVNDIVVHNSDPRHGIRYRVEVDGREIGSDIIGDGIVVATPLGSGGYYRSITDSIFEAGIGLAFNNSTEQSDHMVLGESAEIRVAITRGPAVIYADNQEGTIALTAGDSLVIRKSKKVARLVKVI